MSKNYYNTIQEKSMPIKFQLFPRSQKISQELVEVVCVFTEKQNDICKAKGKHLRSDKVLSILADDLSSLGFEVETGKKKDNLIKVPVHFWFKWILR